MKKVLSFAINDYMGSQNDLQGCVELRITSSYQYSASGND
jgi:hypothetical protein